MLQPGTYLLESVGVVRELSPATQLLLVRFAYNDEDCYMFGNYNDTMEFINKKVIVEFREEMVEGKIASVVNNITVVNQVTGIERTDKLKLYTDHEYTIGANVIFKNIQEGETVDKAIVLCKLAEKESSDRASWVKLTVLDKNRNIGYIRVFDADGDGKAFEGKYIKCAVRKTKFGFNATDVYVKDDVSVSQNPKVKIAREYVEANVAEDETLYSYISKFNLLDKIELYNHEEGEEQGMLMVRLAMEISFINEMENLTNEVDLEMLRRLAVASKSYVVSTPDTTTYSKTLQSIIALTTHTISKDRKLLVALDDSAESPIKIIEREIYDNIQSLAKSLIKISGPEGYISTLEGIKR